jgi:hypothetical protein
LNIVWQHCKNRALEQSSEKISNGEELKPGEACLVFRQKQGKTDPGLDMAHIISKERGGNYRVVIPSNKMRHLQVRVEHHHNLLRLHNEHFNAEVPLGPSRVGQTIKVCRNKKPPYSAIVLQEFETGRLRISPVGKIKGVIDGITVEQTANGKWNEVAVDQRLNELVRKMDRAQRS